MQRSFVKRPFKSEGKAIHEENMFSSQEDVRLPILPQLARNENQAYHFVGPQTLRDQILIEREGGLKSRNESLDHFEQRQSLVDLSKSMQTTIKRSSILSKLSKHETKQFTREMRNLRYYKEYQEKWQNQSKNIRKFTEKGVQPTLLETSIKRLQVLPNPEKDELVKNYVNSFWEMSLRNNNLILKRHIKGENRYGENELEELLQREEGRREVERSIPKLPLEKLKNTDYRELSLTGRNKLASQSMSCDPSLVSHYTTRLSKAMTDGAALDKNQEILKMNYDSAHHFLKEQTLYASD